MIKWSELKTGILKGIGCRPTRFLLRWSPIIRNPFRFDLLEVMKCESDGGVVTLKSAQSPLGLHAGHRILSPRCYGLFDFMKVQMRIIR